MHLDFVFDEFEVPREGFPGILESDDVHDCSFVEVNVRHRKRPTPGGGEPWFLGDCRLVLLEDAVFDVLAELAGDRVADGLEVFALVEGIQRVAHEEPVDAVHDAQAANDHLVVEHDLCESLQVAHRGTFLEGEHVHLRDAEAVELRFPGLAGGLGGGLGVCHDVLLDEV